MSLNLSVDAFIRKWRAVELKERSAAQEHFIDLCHVLGEPTPAEADPTGESYCFERGATKTTGGEGWADVWKRGHFGWEYKGKRKNLEAAFGQLQQYALALENPPVLIVCDLDKFVIRTNWTNTVSERYEFALEGLREPRTLQKLKWAMSDPERLRPGKTLQNLTEDAAGEFATLAQNLRACGHDPVKVAHFINRLVFCMFAEDADLLPNKMFVRMLEAAKTAPDEFEGLASTLFAAMKDGGLVGFERIEWFNGGLFDDSSALPLTQEDITLCLKVASLNWSEIDPSIFGTLFVRGDLRAIRAAIDRLDLHGEPLYAPAQNSSSGRATPKTTSAHALALWRGARPVAGTPAETYLFERGFDEPPPATIRFLPRYHYELRGKYYAW